MAIKRKRERVNAEITLFHLILLANEHGYRVSHQQATCFLNETESAEGIWEQMRQARLNFILGSLLPSAPTPRGSGEVQLV
jgi:hypothetical protein